MKDPDFMFIILSVKHKNYSQRNSVTNLIELHGKCAGCSIKNFYTVRGALLKIFIGRPGKINGSKNKRYMR